MNNFKTCSLNLASWLILQGYRDYTVNKIDDKYYIVFNLDENSEEILNGIKTYKTNKELRKFIYNYQVLREKIKTIR